MIFTAPTVLAVLYVVCVYEDVVCIKYTHIIKLLLSMYQRYTSSRIQSK